MKAGTTRVLTMLLAFAAAPALAQRVIDTHVHLYQGESSLIEYEEQAKAAKLDVAAGVMWFGGPNQALHGAPDRIRANNDQLIAMVAKHPGMIPIATVHPYDGEAALAELQRLASRGVKVLKIHPHTQKFDAADPRVLALVKRAGELSVIVLMDNASILPGDCEKLFNLAIQAPKTRFIFAHMGATNFRFWNILPLARTADGVFAENVYFDISGTVVLFADSPVEEEFVWTLRNVGVDHVLLGSDFPQLTLEKNLKALERLGLTAEEQNAIRAGNARKLLGLKGN